MPKADTTPTELADVIRSETVIVAKQLDRLLDRVPDAETHDQAAALVAVRAMAKKLAKLCTPRPE